MKRTDIKSHCPINYTLETFGDPWSLLIVRDIVYFGKRTYGEFLASEERMATNILATRLADLEKRGILAKKPHPADKRKEVYHLTEKGLDTIPMLFELANWGADYDPKTDAPKIWLDAVHSDKPAVLKIVRQTVKDGGSIFVGSNSVLNQLQLQ